jgi:hypothetical protein
MSVEALIEAIHASPVRLSLCICGAGAGCITRLTQVPQCSRTLLEADVLYHRAATRVALDGLPKHLVSAEAARRLAQHAFHVSRSLAVVEAREASPAPESMSDSRYLFGVGATSAIQTSRVRRSSDQVFVSVWGGAVHANLLNPPTLEPDSVAEVGDVYDYHMALSDCLLDRGRQDRQVELLVLHAIAETVARCCSGHPAPPLQCLLPASPSAASSAASVAGDASKLAADASEHLCEVPSRAGPHRVALDTAHEVAEAIQDVLSYHPKLGEPEEVCVLWNRHGELRRAGHVPYDAEWDGTPTEQRSAEQPSPTSAAAVPPLRLLYPGSFNPLHYGHTELVQAAGRVLRQQPVHQHDPYTPLQVTYEIAVKVVDKGAIECEDLQRRVAQFLDRGERVAVTNAKLFISKAKLFPGHGFLIGIDTALRVVDPQYYSNSTDPQAAEEAMVHALQRDIGDRGCYFVVGGRKVSDPAGWQDLSTLRIPSAIQHLFVGIPDAEFRVDVSSTELRARKRSRPPAHAEANSNM